MKERDRYIDFIKGIAILLVLWGHCIQYGTCSDAFFENPLFKFIYSFHMPLFMLISGYLFAISVERHTLWETISKRLLSMGVPIIVWSVIPDMILHISNGEKITFSSIRDSLTSLWFLWSVLILSIMVTVIEKCSKSKKIVALLLIICAGGVMLLLPERGQNLFMYPYFLLGHYYYKCRNIQWVKKYNGIVKAISLILFPMFIGFYTTNHYIYRRNVST